MMDSRDTTLARAVLTRAINLFNKEGTLHDFICEQSKLIDALQEEYEPLYPYVEAAHKIQREGELEVDDGAQVSKAEDADGAYVQAWLWISNEEAGFPSIYSEED